MTFPSDAAVIDEPTPATPSEVPLMDQLREGIAPEAPAPELHEGVADEPQDDSPVVTYLRQAGVTVRLAHPFQLGDRTIEAVHLPPVSLGVALDVQAGLHETLMAILVVVTGEPLALFRALRGGDEEAVIGAFLPLLPAWIRGALEGAS